MGPILASLLKLQGIEHDLAHVRRRLRSKENAVQVVQNKIDELTAEHKVLHDKAMHQQSETDQYELERASREEDIGQLRLALNRTRTNKEYAAILTQINSYKADNSKLEDEILGILDGVEATKRQAEKIAVEIEEEGKRLDHVTETNAVEVDKLKKLLAELQAKRQQAVKHVDVKALAMFDRMAHARDGEAMVPIEVVNSKRGEYSCGGCYMSLTAEHYNALLSKDEIRHCDSCDCILYIADDTQSQT